MSNYDRGARFSPFEALTGYEDAVLEIVRFTDSKIKLDEYGLDKLNERLNRIQDAMREHPEVSITYFITDQKKAAAVILLPQVQ